MKKFLFAGALILIAILIMGTADSNAAWNSHQNRRAQRDARHVLRRTGMVLQRVQEVANQQREGHHQQNYHHGRKHQHYGLGWAFAHQKRARNLYERRRYEDAIYHSLRSRAIALHILERFEHLQGQPGHHEGWNQTHGNNDEEWRHTWKDDNDDDIRNCDMDRSEMDEIELRYWDRSPQGSELSVGLEKWFVSDDDVLSFEIEFNF